MSESSLFDRNHLRFELLGFKFDTIQDLAVKDALGRMVKAHVNVVQYGWRMHGETCQKACRDLDRALERCGMTKGMIPAFKDFQEVLDRVGLLNIQTTHRMDFYRQMYPAYA